jgi:hypothetical protein
MKEREEKTSCVEGERENDWLRRRGSRERERRGAGEERRGERRWEAIQEGDEGRRRYTVTTLAWPSM